MRIINNKRLQNNYSLIYRKFMSLHKQDDRLLLVSNLSFPSLSPSLLHYFLLSLFISLFFFTSLFSSEPPTSFFKSLSPPLFLPYLFLSLTFSFILSRSMSFSPSLPLCFLPHFFLSLPPSRSSLPLPRLPPFSFHTLFFLSLPSAFSTSSFPFLG